MKKKSKYLPRNVGAMKLTMKFTLFFLFISYLQCTASTYAQQTKMSVAIQDASVYQVLEAIENQSDFTFLYRSNLFDKVDKQNVEIQNVTVYEYLDKYLVPEGFEYVVKDKTVVIREFLTQNNTAQQAEHTVTGKVLDDKGFPLPGVAIMVKGTTTGTITDIDGNYVISNLQGNEVLVFSFIGMQRQEVPVAGQSSINITLQADAIGLDEVVAVGYGYKKRSVVTGAISSLSSDDLLQSKPADINQALGGRAAGVVVSQASGQPGSSPKIVIRGVGTNGNSDPLYIIDGLPMSDMTSVNPSDIESMEVLKDATSAAIYGARGANGVILITTKKGKKGESTLTYNGFYGVQGAFNQPDMLKTDGYLELMKEFYANDGSNYPEVMPTENLGVDTDWLNEITDTAPVQEHNVTATMGGEKGSTLLSLGYRNQDGIIGGDKSFFKRYNARINTFMDVKEYITIGANINFTHIDKNGISTGTNGYNPVYYALQMDPTTPVYGDGLVAADEDGYGVSSVPFSRMWNPFSFMDVTSNGYNKTERFFGNVFAEIELISGLKFKTDFATNLSSNNRRSFSREYNHRSDINSTVSSVSQNSSRSTFWQWENTLNYTKEFNGHSLGVLVGISSSEDTYEWLSGTRNDLPVEAETNSNFWYLNSGDVGSASNGGSANAIHSLYSRFGRASYSYKEKYMAEFVVRVDGSSNFGPSNKYGTFPGVSAGWNVSSEEFWTIKNFDYLKLRASWGQNGNEDIDAFSYTSIVGNDQYYTLGTNSSVVTGSAPTSLVNPDVKWETSEQINIGADMGLFNNKLRANVDYYVKTTKDLLFQRTVEDVRGNEASYYNLGKVKNSGVEIQLGTNFDVGEVSFAVNANASYLKNEVEEVGNDNGYEEGGSWKASYNVTRMQEGYPIGYFYGYKIDGIFQTQSEVDSYTDEDGNLTYPNAQAGDFKWHDTNGDKQITAEDKTDIGNPWPKWTYGVNISANWKNFDFSVFVHGKADVDVWMSQYRDEAYGRSNLPSFWLDRWQKEGDDKGVPRVTLADLNNNVRNPSEFHVRDASFFKIGTIELGYTFPEKILKSVNLSNVRIYGAIDNVAIFTDYPMFDPEVGAMEGNILNTGLDYSMYPQARTFRAGINLAF
ncbi:MULTISPECIES: SusC/RagA family TonB-linked outer membrane protein [unclassified Saccharicrinis]|uniref:SusC/RagA family TonB-linked outer membrane protein n=1 Tax=unclassified Saccharicrinis TaxID=2646859 RepID=UPI003D336350